LEKEWTGILTSRTNALAYRDELWAFAWQRFEESVARRGKLSAPNLFMTRGRLLVSQRKYAQAIKEFEVALVFAQNSSYDVVRQELSTQALFAIGVAYWHTGNYKLAEEWLLKAQAVQRQSARLWLPDLDAQVEQIKALAKGT
jgi:tetratricopeptide (TPR) repeat protein